MRCVKIVLSAIAAVAFFAALAFFYVHRFDRPMLYYYGASPEVPQGRSIPVFNPLRDHNDEKLAERLIRDLRTPECERIVKERLQSEPAQVCPLLRSENRVRLIWIGPKQQQPFGASRLLYYDLPKAKARLSVYFGMDESGWEITTVSVLR